MEGGDTMNEQQTEQQQSEQPSGEFRFRTAELLDVSYPKRIIELVCAPYDQEALVAYEGRMIHESFKRGCWDGLERRANRVRVNRDHDLKRTVGRALAFHPSRDEGLVSEVKIAKTELGDETLALAEEGILDCSAAYLPMPQGEHWQTRNRVTITRAFLGHLALTPDPAYEGAKVLAMRSADELVEGTETPHLDQVRAWLLEDKLSRFDQ